MTKEEIMGCGCNKNKPRVHQGPRNPSIVAQSNQQNVTLRVNNTPRPSAQSVRPQTNDEQVKSQQAPQPNADSLVHPSNSELSPAGLDAHRRRVESLRREARRNAFNR